VLIAAWNDVRVHAARGVMDCCLHRIYYHWARQYRCHYPYLALRRSGKASLRGTLPRCDLVRSRGSWVLRGGSLEFGREPEMVCGLLKSDDDCCFGVFDYCYYCVCLCWWTICVPMPVTLSKSCDVLMANAKESRDARKESCDNLRESRGVQEQSRGVQKQSCDDRKARA
jgi:hypothetical protein